jgi:hypothetical protein
VLLAVSPRYRILIFSAPDGGATENVSILPTTPYVDGACKTPDTATITDDAFGGATVN